MRPGWGNCGDDPPSTAYRPVGFFVGNAPSVAGTPPDQAQPGSPTEAGDGVKKEPDDESAVPAEVSFELPPHPWKLRQP